LSGERPHRPQKARRTGQYNDAPAQGRQRFGVGRNLDQDENEPAFNVGKWGIEMNGLDEGQKVSFEVVADRRTGKSSAGNLRRCAALPDRRACTH
jgi:cold shock CspA family protein